MSVYLRVTLWLFVALVGVGSFVMVQFASAHSTGFAIEQTVDGYFVDIGFSEQIILPDNSVRLDFDVLDDELREAVEFTDLWVRIEQDKKLYFAGGLNKPRFGRPGFSYAFPQEGEYQLYVRYQNETEKVVDLETNFTVYAREMPPEPFALEWVSAAIGFGGGLIVGGLGVWLVRRRKSLYT